MKYLLIDFGLSFVKTCLYDNSTKDISLLRKIVSPFSRNSSITQIQLQTLFNSIFNSYGQFDKIAMCHINGGGYYNGKYYSWKHHDKSLLLTGKLSDNIDFKGIPVVSMIGDTECSIYGINLKDNEYIINMGTGSQVISNQKMIKYIPSGIPLLVYQRFFELVDFDMFDRMQYVTMQDMFKSTLVFDLNLYSEALNFKQFGSIKNITEENLTITNFLASLLRSYCEQYITIVKPNNPIKIHILGGIPKRLPILHQYIRIRCNCQVVINMNLDDTLTGLIKIIQERQQ